jgi:hypothetical protein
MAWQTPPTFSYGYPADPDDMNILRNDLLYLYGEVFNTPTANIESMVHLDFDSLNTYYTAAICWLEHKGDNLYYRINIKGERSGDDQDIRLRIRYIKSPYFNADDTVNAGYVMGEHTELNTDVGKDWVLYTNSDAAVDISGWNLVVGTIYAIQVEARSESHSGDNAWAEVQMLYEVP